MERKPKYTNMINKKMVFKAIFLSSLKKIISCLNEILYLIIFFHKHLTYTISNIFLLKIKNLIKLTIICHKIESFPPFKKKFKYQGKRFIPMHVNFE